MPHSVTVTAKTGPNRTNTAIAYPDVLGIELNLKDSRLFIQTVQGVGDNIKEYDLSGVTGIAVTITAGVYAVVIT